MFNAKIFVAELIGTFALVFIGAGAGIAGAGLLGVALAHGLVVATFAYTFGYISGTHINPAVTFAMAFRNKVKWGEAVYYWIAQFAGAGLAGWLLSAAYGDISGGATIGLLTVESTMNTQSALLAMAVEAILTFFLVNAILHNTGAGKTGALAGLVIGLTLTICILAGGALTGASLNPARTFGTAIFAAPSFADPYTYVVYFFGPLIGATLALIAYNFFTGEDEQEEQPAEKNTVKKTTRKATKK
ncbi:MAG: aquaporin [Anaerolineales bacterium]|nr:aquaporin [Anaerolineales bacterium]